MTNKIKVLLLSVLCSVLIGGAALSVSAQKTDKVLVSAGGKSLSQVDVEKLIAFYEWAFKTEFTAGERKRFQTLSIEHFEEQPATARKDSDTLIKVYSQVIKKDAAAQIEMRKLFNDGFVKDLRTGTDEASRLLLNIYERGQEIVEVLPSEEDLREAEAPVTAPSGGLVPKNLVGRWMKSGGAGGSRDYTGKTLYNSGNDVILEFRADGTMQFVNDKNTLSITQCRITEMIKIPGTYRTNGDSLTMSFTAGTHVGTSSCERSGNFKKSVSSSTLAKKFIVKRLDSVFRPDAPLILCFDGSDDNDCFELANK